MECFSKICILASSSGILPLLNKQELRFLTYISGDSDTDNVSWIFFFFLRKNGVDYEEILNGLKQRNDKIALFLGHASYRK